MSIQELIDKALMPSVEKRKRSGKFSPSSLGKCFRAQIWNRMDIPQEQPDARTLRVFKAGNLFHDFVQGVICENHKDIKKEVKVEDDHFFGYADLVNGETVWDIKSQHSQAFHWMAKSKDITEDKKQNILQVMLYCKLLGKKEGRLVFVSKDDLCIAEYGFSYNERWQKELEAEVNTLIEYWFKDVIPAAQPRAYKKKDGSFAECGYCPFRNMCNEFGSEEIKRVK